MPVGTPPRHLPVVLIGTPPSIEATRLVAGSLAGDSTARHRLMRDLVLARRGEPATVNWRSREPRR